MDKGPFVTAWRWVPLILMSGMGVVGNTSAALIDRGGGLVYDDVLNITWLQDANYAKTSGFDADGVMSWSEAKTWASNLIYHDSVRNLDLTGWRLPTVGPANGSGFNYAFAYNGSTDYGYNITSPRSEMAYMFYFNLGNKGMYSSTADGQPVQTGYGLSNTGPFLNLGGLNPAYWYGTEFNPPAFTDAAWSFHMDDGGQGVRWTGATGSAWAVRGGDVTGGVAHSPSVATLAALANDVYGANKGTLDYSFRACVCSGEGFEANLYRNGDQYVIAVRGTDPDHLNARAYNLLSDSSFVTGNADPDPNFAANVQSLAALVAQIHSSDPNAIVTLTGHSLGGAVAQLVANGAGVQAITFDAPGAGAFVPTFSSYFASEFTSPIPSPSSQITNFRLYGDQVSRVGQQIGSTITVDSPTGAALADLPWMFLPNHDPVTLLNQIVNNASQATGIPFTDVNWVPSVIFALKGLTDPTALSYFLAVADAVANHLFDPPPGSTYSLVENPGSPEIATIQLPIYGPIAGWEIRYLGNDGWHDYALAANGLVDFGSGATGVDFYPVDAMGNEIAQLDPFLFNLTFTSPGQFDATLDVGNSFVQTPGSSVPEPATLALLTVGVAGLGFSRRKQQSITHQTQAPLRRGL